jgi:hypothetical protein
MLHQEQQFLRHTFSIWGEVTKATCDNCSTPMVLYEEVGQATAPGNIQWAMVMKNLCTAQWKDMEDKQKVDEPEGPKITKALPVIKWTQAFRD